jgi:hypothetical protein
MGLVLPVVLREKIFWAIEKNIEEEEGFDVVDIEDVYRNEEEEEQK